ncbi:HPr family phosphocarrier protein [Candidatus Aerophobetes bacterium]|mgnify:CR=1 FL=1|uniref:HPr family phosphocarrier protein n=1 Tax=Aerophobetes bacterium TaxID=2030807 RepID=A0A497E657_UNCAE|nr:MAG: HPr family phosphocarrier protein [Candidatus Aerophobetes bacterium]
MNNIVEREVEILNKVGLHIRPASLLVEVARKFKSRIWLEKDGQIADGKSVTSLLLLSAEKGSKVNIKAQGPDAQEAVEALMELIGNKFGEE